MNSRDVGLTVVFASLYSVIVYVLSEISFGLVQVRVADCLVPLSMLFGWPVIVGVAAGCLVGNLVSPMPSIITDMTFGALANLVASFLAWKIGCRKSMKTANAFFGCVAATVVITFVVGTYLALLTEMELWVWWLGVGVGSMISINILGYTLVQTIKKTGVV